MSVLFGYYGLGLASLHAAQAGIQVSGDNIANINTPGFARRSLTLNAGLPVRVPGGILSNGVAIGDIRRQQDGILQFSLGRQQALLAGSDETLRGLKQIEAVFGSLQGDNLSTAYGEFANAFNELAAVPEGLTHRRAAIAAAQNLAQQISSNYTQLNQQLRAEDDNVRLVVTEVNALSAKLEELNRNIASTENGLQQNAPLRDQRDQVIARLTELTGGNAVPDGDGRLQFVLPGGGTLVTSAHARPLETTIAADGTAQLSLGGKDLTAQIRGGQLGALLALRDETLPDQLQSLDAIAADLITRANALTAGASDRNGDPGIALFDPDPAPATGAAQAIAVNAAVLQDPSLLAVSGDGSAGNGTIATEIAGIADTSSTDLGGRSPNEYLVDLVSGLGTAVAKADVTQSTSSTLVQQLEAQRQSISGVSLDEEAVEIVKFQRSYEAAARFISVLNELTGIAVSLGA